MDGVKLLGRCSLKSVIPASNHSHRPTCINDQVEEMGSRRSARNAWRVIAALTLRRNQSELNGKNAGLKTIPIRLNRPSGEKSLDRKKESEFMIGPIGHPTPI